MPDIEDRTAHPARRMAFGELMAGLEAACGRGMVYRRRDEGGGRTLYCYTRRCVYDAAWDRYSVLARGLIVDEAAGCLVATPFPKFFNLGEGRGAVPDLPFEAFEKVDGSLIVIHHHHGRWMAATKGDLASSQAAWAQAMLDTGDLSCLAPGATYLAEAVYPANRNVVRYGHEGLVLLAGYAADGVELDHGEVAELAGALGWRHAARQPYASMAELVASARELPGSLEGYVLHFSDGTRLKIKGGEYCRLHALIARCTPLGVWDMMVAADDLDAVRRDIPEEFWGDFDAIRALLEGRVAATKARITEAAASVAHLSDKELGTASDALPEELRGYVFSLRRSRDTLQPRTLQAILRAVRPTGDVLDGYQPSYAARRAREDDG